MGLMQVVARLFNKDTRFVRVQIGYVDGTDYDLKMERIVNDKARMAGTAP